MRNNKIGKQIFFGVLLILWISLAGCGKEKGISLDEVPDRMQTEGDSTEKKDSDSIGESAGEARGTQEHQEKNESGADSASGTLSVYVCGAVHAPGVYELPAGSRLYQAVDMAGGMREDADRNYLNLAMELTDGMKLQVPTKEETLAGAAGVENTEKEQMFGNGEADFGKEASEKAGLVNINTADAARLMTLPGIGEAKAESIIAYREEKGAFKRKEDIMNITGIKQAVYDKIKDAICVN